MPSDPAESTIEYSRPSLEHDLYRHPSVQLLPKAMALGISSPSANSQHEASKRAQYRQYYELYSFGIILIEIGLWEQISTLWKPHYTPERFPQKLLDGYVPKLGPKMGARYRDIVRSLLTLELSVIEKRTDDYSDAKPAENQAARAEMYWRVVKPLEECRA